MTARPELRRRRTITGALVTVGLLVVAGVLVAVGAAAVVNSEAGEVVEADTRPVVMLPATDNAAIAIVDDDNRLTALAVVTLNPSGVGGSIITVPVNADASIGLGSERRPLDLQLDPADPSSFFEAVEGTLAVSLKFGEIVNSERLAEFLAPVTPARVNFAKPVVNVSEADAELSADELVLVPVVESGTSDIDVDTIIAALRSSDVRGSSYDHHQFDVELWSALARRAPAASSPEVPLDEFGRAVPAEDLGDLVSRLWAGRVDVRDLALQPSVPDGEIDSVVLDRTDGLLVFAQTSPARVSTPNIGRVFRLEVPYSDEQLEDADVDVATRADLARTAIGDLLFFQANVTSVDTSPNRGAVLDVTLIEVANADFIEEVEELAPLIFGETNVVPASTLIDGVDVVVTLGTSYLDFKAES